MVVVGVGSRTTAGGVGVTVGKLTRAGVGVTTRAVVSSVLVETTGVAERMVVAVTLGGVVMTEVSVATNVSVSAAVVETATWLTSGPTRAPCGVIGGGVSGKGLRVIGESPQLANRRVTRRSSARLLATIRDNMH
jgi:hypothetical protein